MKRWIIISVVLIVAILTVWLFFGRKDKNIVKVVKGKVTRGELALKVSARGRIEAKVTTHKIGEKLYPGSNNAKYFTVGVIPLIRE